ncbi:Hypothetical protein FKW44_001457, partial [Caligus rogercresseyi]
RDGILKALEEALHIIKNFDSCFQNNLERTMNHGSEIAVRVKACSTLNVGGASSNPERGWSVLVYLIDK